VDEALQFYRPLSYCLPFFYASTDATALRSQITCRLQDNAIFGLATLNDLRCPATLDGLANMALQYKMASQVNVILLNPLDPSVPSFLIAAFPEAGGVDVAAVKELWSLIDHCFSHAGVHILAHGSDGYPSELSAMLDRQASRLMQTFSTTVKCLTGSTITIAAPAVSFSLGGLKVTPHHSSSLNSALNCVLDRRPTAALPGSCAPCRETPTPPHQQRTEDRHVRHRSLNSHRCSPTWPRLGN
jgi:hypothetical protein